MFACAFAFVKHPQDTIYHQYCNQGTQQQASKDITPVMLVVTNAGQPTQNTQLSNKQLEGKLQKPAMGEIDHDFHIQNCKCHSICCKYEKKKPSLE